MFQRLWAVWRGLKSCVSTALGCVEGPEEPKLTSKCPVLRWQLWDDDLLRFGGLLSRKMLQQVNRKEVKVV